MKIARLLMAVCLPPLCSAQNAAPPAPDVLILVDGEKLIGHLERVEGKTVRFKSDLAGAVTIDLSKVKEIQSSNSFAVVPKSFRVGRHGNPAGVPQGTIAITDQKLQVSPPNAPPRALNADDIAAVVPEAEFQKAITNPGLLQDWRANVTAGFSLVEATQNSRTLTVNSRAVRTVPGEDWVDPRNRTSLDFDASYGTISQPGQATVKTDIIHGGAERDEYFSARSYGFGAAIFDHNYAQGLDLQQDYGVGMGRTVLKTAVEQLDLKISVNYIRQQFQSGPAQNLIGSELAQTFSRRFRHGAILSEQAEITPAWNNLNAYTAAATATFTVPLTKRLLLTFGSTDAFLNDPPPGFKKNSFQLTTGITYPIP